MNIINLENHPELEKEIKSVERFIEEEKKADACFHLRKALEYVIQEFIKENPDCKGENLFGDICNLENSDREIVLINVKTCNLFHKIRKKTNAYVHFNSNNDDNITYEELKDLLNDFEKFLYEFCEEYKEPSAKPLPTYDEKNEEDIPSPSIKYSKDEFVKLWNACYNRQKVLMENGNIPWKRLVWIDVDKEYIYPTRDGIWHIDSKSLVKDIDKKIERLKKSDKYISDENGGWVAIPGFLQSTYDCADIYMDGLEVCETYINWNYVIAEALILFDELYLPNEEMVLECPEKMYEDIKEWFGRKSCFVKKPELKELVLSSKTSIDSDFAWTDYAKEVTIYHDEGDEGYITIDEEGSIYTLDYKELLHFRGPYEGELIVNEGVEVIGKKAFNGEDLGVTNISLPVSVKLIKEGSFANLKNKRFVIPRNITIIEEGAFHETTQVFYEYNLDKNINTLYDIYLEKKAKREAVEEKNRKERAEYEKRMRKEAELQKKLEDEQQKKEENNHIKNKDKKVNIKIVFVVISFFCIFISLLNRYLPEKYEKQEVVYINDKTYIVNDEFRIKCKIKNDNISFEVVEYIGNSKKVVVPNEFKEYPVVGIADTVFNDNDLIEEVIIEVTSQEEGTVFKNCSELKSVYYPDSVKVLTFSTFENCPKLESISVSDKCRFSPIIIKDETKEQLGKEINIVRRTDTENYTSKMILQDIEKLKDIKSENENYFYNYNSFEGIKITDIEEDVKEISLPRRINEYNIYIINDIYGKNIKILDASLCSELEYNFKVKRCEHLEEIRYPASITEIDEYAISDCPNLKKIVVYQGCKVNSIYEERGIVIEYIE